MDLNEAIEILNVNNYLLTERILNVGLPNSKYSKEDYIDEVMTMLTNSYKHEGGLIGVDRDELLEPNVFWKLVRADGKIIACMIYKFKLYGRKILCGGTDGTEEGKIGFKNIMREDYIHREKRLCFTEVSGKPRLMFIKLGMPKIPIESAEKILKEMNKEILEPGQTDPGYSYIRMIGGKPLEKTMFGYYPSKYE